MNSLCSPGTSAPGLAFLKWSLALVVAFWLLVALLWSIFEKDLWEESWLFIFTPVRWGLIGSGVILALVALRQIMPGGENRHCAIAALFLAISGLVMMFAGREFLSQDVRFLLSKAHYERRVAEVLAGRRAKAPDIAAIERGPPDRVAFYWKRGVTDNWVGLVYDPTGDVVNAAACQDFFGGTMTHSRHLTGPWFICWFT